MGISMLTVTLVLNFNIIGNFLLMPDGRIAMIDYGQIKCLSIEERKSIAKLIISIAEQNYDEIIQNMKATGFKTKNSNPEVMYKMAVVTLDQGSFYDNVLRWQECHRWFEFATISR
jgi:hypothetical protein